MKIGIDGLREQSFAQMRLPPLPEYSGDTLILRALPNSGAVQASLTKLASMKMISKLLSHFKKRQAGVVVHDPRCIRTP